MQLFLDRDSCLFISLGVYLLCMSMEMPLRGQKMKDEFIALTRAEQKEKERPDQTKMFIDWLKSGDYSTIDTAKLALLEIGYSDPQVESFVEIAEKLNVDEKLSMVEQFFLAESTGDQVTLNRLISEEKKHTSAGRVEEITQKNNFNIIPGLGSPHPSEVDKDDEGEAA